MTLWFIASSCWFSRMGFAGWGKHENSRNTMLPSSWPWISSVSRLMKYYALMLGSMIKECKDPVFKQPGFHEMNVLGGFYCKPVHLNQRQFRIGKSLRYAPIHVSYLWARMEKSLVHQHAQHATSACASFPSTLITPLSPLKRQNVGKHKVTWDTLCTNRKKTHWHGESATFGGWIGSRQFTSFTGLGAKGANWRMAGWEGDVMILDLLIIWWFCVFFSWKITIKLTIWENIYDFSQASYKQIQVTQPHCLIFFIPLPILVKSVCLSDDGF